VRREATLSLPLFILPSWLVLALPHFIGLSSLTRIHTSVVV